MKITFRGQVSPDRIKRSSFLSLVVARTIFSDSFVLLEHLAIRTPSSAQKQKNA